MYLLLTRPLFSVTEDSESVLAPACWKLTFKFKTNSFKNIAVFGVW